MAENKKDKYFDILEKDKIEIRAFLVSEAGRALVSKLISQMPSSNVSDQSADGAFAYEAGRKDGFIRCVDYLLNAGGIVR